MTTEDDTGRSDTDDGSGGGSVPWVGSDIGGDEDQSGLADVVKDEESPDERRSLGILPSVPNTFVTLGAGCLATASLLTFAAFLFVTWMLWTGNTRSLAPYQLGLAAMQMGFATVFLAVGSYFGMKRVRWTIVMLAALIGSFAVLTIPFTLIAIITIGLGRIHFSASFLD